MGKKHKKTLIFSDIDLKILSDCLSFWDFWTYSNRKETENDMFLMIVVLFLQNCNP